MIKPKEARKTESRGKAKRGKAKKSRTENGRQNKEDMVFHMYRKIRKRWLSHYGLQKNTMQACLIV
jgi:hypothetical protein